MKVEILISGIVAVVFIFVFDGWWCLMVDAPWLVRHERWYQDKRWSNEVWECGHEAFLMCFVHGLDLIRSCCWHTFLEEIETKWCVAAECLICLGDGDVVGFLYEECKRNMMCGQFRRTKPPKVAPEGGCPWVPMSQTTDKLQIVFFKGILAQWTYTPEN